MFEIIFFSKDPEVAVKTKERKRRLKIKIGIEIENAIAVVTDEVAVAQRNQVVGIVQGTFFTFLIDFHYKLLLLEIAVNPENALRLSVIAVAQSIVVRVHVHRVVEGVRVHQLVGISELTRTLIPQIRQSPQHLH